MTQPHTHASHPAIIKRLRKASGHLSSTIEMLGQGRTCLNVTQQQLQRRTKRFSKPRRPWSGTIWMTVSKTSWALWALVSAIPWTSSGNSHATS